MEILIAIQIFFYHQVIIIPLTYIFYITIIVTYNIFNNFNWINTKILGAGDGNRTHASSLGS